MRATILPWAVVPYDGKGVYCGPSTASEVFLIFTTQLYSWACNYDEIFSYIGKREVLQQDYNNSQYSHLHTSGG